MNLNALGNPHCVIIFKLLNGFLSCSFRLDFMNSNVRKITDGAMMVAIMGAMLLINRQTAGLLESMALFIFPLPMVFYSAKYGWKDSWMVLVCILLICFLLGSIQSLIFAVSESFIGMIYGAGIHNHTDTRRIVVRTLILGALVELFTMLVFAEFFGYDLVGETDLYKEMVNKMLGDNRTLNIDLDSYIRTILVFSTILTGILEGFITHVISRIMLKRLRFHLEPSKPILEYYPPKWSGYVAIAGLILNMIVSTQFTDNTTLVYFSFGYEMAGILYLAFFGFITFITYGKMRFPNSKFGPALFALLLFMFASIILAMFGFLYITSDLHQNMLEDFKRGGNNHAEENK